MTGEMIKSIEQLDDAMRYVSEAYSEVASEDIPDHIFEIMKRLGDHASLQLGINRKPCQTQKGASKSWTIKLKR